MKEPESQMIHSDVTEITREIIAGVLHEVCIYLDGWLEITWNFRDEFGRLKLDLLKVQHHPNEDKR